MSASRNQIASLCLVQSGSIGSQQVAYLLVGHDDADAHLASLVQRQVLGEVHNKARSSSLMASMAVAPVASFAASVGAAVGYTVGVAVGAAVGAASVGTALGAGAGVASA